MPALTRALLVVGFGILLVGRGAPASADSLQPFDERECFCRSGAITDLAAGHFVFDAERGSVVFVVDEGLTASVAGEVHAPGDTIPTGVTTAAGSGTFLGFVPEGDSLPCFSPLSGDDLDVATLTHVACGHFTDWQGRTVPDECHQRVRLRRVVSFAEALVDGEDCYAAASEIGVHPPESAGCAGGSAAGRGVVVVSSLGLLALGLWRRRRAARRGALVLAGLGIALAGTAHAKPLRPFDARDCFCDLATPSDLATGHFALDRGGAVVFVVDVGLTPGSDGSVRAPGDVIDDPGVAAAGSGVFLSYAANDRTKPCFAALSDADPEVATVRDLTCGTSAGACKQDVPLRDVVPFAEALAEGAECHAAATTMLGVAGPSADDGSDDGCAGGSAGGWGAALLALVALVGRRSRVCARALGTRALVVSGVVGGLIGCGAQAHAKVLPPFDGRDCFCHLTTLIDLATGHFELDAEGAVLFVVDVGLTAGSDGSVRAADDVIEVSGLESAGSGAFLSYSANGRTHACFAALSDPDPEVATVRELMCGASAQGCIDDIPLRDVVRFAEARADGAECYAAATSILGVAGPASDDGCAGGRPGLWIGALVVLALGLWSRRRAALRGALVLVVLIGSGAATTTDTRACSLEQAPLPGMSPPTGETIGPLPLLVSRVGFPGQLQRDGSPGVAIAVVRDEGLGTFLVQGQLAEAWRPAEPLAAGAYTWLSSTGTGDAAFFVDPGLATPPPSSRVMALRVLLAEPAEANGCDGSASSCDDIDFTRLDVTFVPVADEAATLHLLELAPQGREVHRELVRSDSEGIGVWDEHAGLPSFKRLGYCVAVTPISDDGIVGTRVDLGCFRPDDDDPRVTDERGGCAGAGAALDPILWIAALLVARRRPSG